MGYVRKKTFKIRFGEGHEFEGLEVRMRSVSIGRMLRLMPKIGALDDIVATKPDEIEDLFRDIAGLIDSWNIEDEDDQGNVVPVPATYEGVIDQDLRMLNCILQEWAQHVAGVPAPLDERSPSGEPFPEASLPMETLSPSPVS